MVILVAAMAATVGVVMAVHTGGSSNDRTTPASSASPPVVVGGVTGPVSDLAGKDFVLPDPLSMSPAELRQFNTDVASDSAAFDAWRSGHQATVVGSGTITFTLRGHDADEVTISDVTMRKRCTAPLDGTYFEGYSQGEGNTVALGFDLDDADPIPELRARTAGGLVPTGRNYFDEKTLRLRPGEQVTFSVGVSSRRHHCSFSLELVVATSHGDFTQRVDRHGKPFTLTAPVRSSAAGGPSARYRSAYREGPDGWHAVTTSGSDTSR